MESATAMLDGHPARAALSIDQRDEWEYVSLYNWSIRAPVSFRGTRPARSPRNNMSDPRKKPTPPESSASAPREPSNGGFGAFADVYRARWAANHPNMRPRGPVPDPAPPGSASEEKSADPGGTRPARPED